LRSGDTASPSPRFIGGERVTRAAFAARFLASFLSFYFAILWPSQPATAQGLRIVATTPDLASLARSLAGDLAQIEQIIPAAVDPEAFEPKPSDLIKLRGASLVLRIGLGYDHWLDKLLASHADPIVQRGGAGYVDASAGIPLLEIKGRSIEAATADGHAHGLANPHYWLDPANAETVTGGIAEAMLAVAPEQRPKIIRQREAFVSLVKQKIAQWEDMLRPYRAARLIAYHNTWPYFARRFRLDIVDVIETKEGVPPSPARLAKLAALMRKDNIRLIVHEPYEPDEASQLLARRTGAVVLKLAPSVGSVPEVPDYISLFDHDVSMLARAFATLSN
jgi:ABC-type Zn uptake system ZnuABC Zn-binding protein ZnuA